MNFKRKITETNAGFQMGPMLDIIFILLIHFMAATIFAQWENKLEIKVPTASSENHSYRQRGEVIINVDEKGVVSINSQELTDILIVVVRYYGGVNLGTSGLIVAYREAAADALAKAAVVTRQVEETVVYDFPYVMMNDVMRVVKDMQPRIVGQTYDNTCQITLSIRKSEAETLRAKLAKLSF